MQFSTIAHLTLRALPICQCSVLHVPSLKLSIAPEGKDDEKEGHGTVSLNKIAPGKNVVFLNCHKKTVQYINAQLFGSQPNVCSGLKQQTIMV